MLHVVNGDATGEALQVAGIEGELLVWRDALLDGPAQNALRSREDWETRAAALSEEWGLNRRAYLAGVRAFLDRVDKEDGPITLWFEEDLFCQLPLCMLLDRVRDASRVGVVCPEWPLGARGPAELRALFEARADGAARQALARRAWRAYGEPSPDALLALLRDDFSAWPLLERGVRAHLARFPSTRSGLGVLETSVLELLRAGPLPFGEVFRRWSEGPLQPVYGLGDHQVALTLHRLASSLDPLVRAEGARPAPDPALSIAGATLALTRVGQAVLAGSRDLVALGLPERWLGGVHLQAGAPVWRWDGATLVRA